MNAFTKSTQMHMCMCFAGAQTCWEVTKSVFETSSSNQMKPVVIKKGMSTSIFHCF